MAKSFSATVSEWARQTEARMTAVFRSSAQAMRDEVSTTVDEGGRLPVKTGNLRRSLLMSTAAMPTTKPGQTWSSEQPDFEMVIGSAELGDKIYLGFQAAYARRLEYGFQGQDALGRTYHQEGRGFVAAAAQRWPQIVAEQAAVIQHRVEGRQK